MYSAYRSCKVFCAMCKMVHRSSSSLRIVELLKCFLGSVNCFMGRVKCSEDRFKLYWS